MLRITVINILFFSVFGVSAQEVPKEIKETNNNSNVLNNSYEHNQSLGTEKQDTIAISNDKAPSPKKMEATEDRKVRRLKKATTRSVRAIEPAESEAPVEEESVGGAMIEDAVLDSENTPEPAQQSAGYMKANYDFTVSKGRASTQPMQRTPLPEQQSQMNDAVQYFEQNAPNSFEYHYFKYTASNYDVDEIDHLRQAEKIMPSNSDVHSQMAAYNIIVEDLDSATMYVDKLIESGRLNTNTLSYAEDLLISAPQNSVLITHGFDDTYSAFQTQQSAGVREDVTLISLDFLQSEYYREKLVDKGFELPEEKVIDVDYLSEFCELNDSKPISISMTTPKEYFMPLQQNLYVVGLTFEYHKDDFNNFERNEKLWNDQLKKHLISDAIDEKSKQLSSNYLPMLLQLRKVYGQQGEKKKLKEIDEAIDKISLQCKKYDQVQKLKSSY